MGGLDGSGRGLGDALLGRLSLPLRHREGRRRGKRRGDRYCDSHGLHFTVWRVALTSVFQRVGPSDAASAASRFSFFEKTCARPAMSLR